MYKDLLILQASYLFIEVFHLKRIIKSLESTRYKKFNDSLLLFYRNGPRLTALVFYWIKLINKYIQTCTNFN